jgi:alkanesulfonate monooxygenase SsuD/methylene tetrahydromethanopterin reductase-like flavin-dependent oxidoreductase (luciferase family)
MANPRDYAEPGNQDPRTPWPSSLVLLAAIAAVTTRLRLFAAAIIPPLRHPLQLAKDLATLDLLCEGRLVVLPTVSWHEDEYEALAVPFRERGARLDEHLEAWHAVWGASPASFQGRFYAFENVYVEPKPYRNGGIQLHFGSSTMHDKLVRRLVRFGTGWNPDGRAPVEHVEKLRAALAVAGRDIAELELVGSTRVMFPGPDRVADLGEALAGIPRQLAEGYTTFCIKPSQFIDDRAQLPGFCQEVIRRVEALTAHEGRAG